MKSCVGLSASVYTALYLGVFEPDARRFILFLAFAPSVVYWLGAPLIGHVPYIQHSELKRRGRRTFTTGDTGVAGLHWGLGWEGRARREPGWV